MRRSIAFGLWFVCLLVAAAPSCGGDDAPAESDGAATSGGAGGTAGAASGNSTAGATTGTNTGGSNSTAGRVGAGGVAGSSGTGGEAAAGGEGGGSLAGSGGEGGHAAEGHGGASGEGGSAAGAGGAGTGGDGGEPNSGAGGMGGQGGAPVSSLCMNRAFTVTAAGTASYLIDSASDPELTLCRGFTYTFNVDAPGHPFLIKTVQGAGNDNQYSTGVTGQGVQDGTLTFAVPESAPDLLYYNCEVHAAMTGAIGIVSP